MYRKSKPLSLQMEYSYYANVNELKSSLYQFGTECILTLFVGVKTLLHTVALFSLGAKSVHATVNVMITFVMHIALYFVQDLFDGVDHMLYTLVHFLLSIFILRGVLQDYAFSENAFSDRNALFLCVLTAQMEVLLHKYTLYPSRLVELKLVLTNSMLMLSIMQHCASYPNKGDIMFFLEVPIGTCLLGFNALMSSDQSPPQRTLNSAVVRSSVIPTRLFFSVPRRGWLMNLYIAYKMFVWGSNMFELASYMTYDDVVRATYPVCNTVELNALQSQMDVCPVCLERHNSHSCRLDCGHTIHIPCLIEILQVVFQYMLCSVYDHVGRTI